MLKAYLVGIPTPYENEDIQIRYRLYQDERCIAEKALYKNYVKPSLVGLMAFLTLLKELRKTSADGLLIVVNDGALQEQIKGTSTTKNADILKLAGKVRDELARFKMPVQIQDVSGNHAELMKWNDELKL